MSVFIRGTGADKPERLLTNQDLEKLVDTDDQWIVHGHTITEEPYAFSGKINVDTGAFATGRLTCVRIGSNEVEFFTVQT